MWKHSVSTCGARAACGSKGDGMGGLDWAADWGTPAPGLGLSIDIMPPLLACEPGPAPGMLPAHRTADQLLGSIAAGLWGSCSGAETGSRTW